METICNAVKETWYKDTTDKYGSLYPLIKNFTSGNPSKRNNLKEKGKKFIAKGNHYIVTSSSKIMLKTITKNSHMCISQDRLGYAMVTNNPNMSVVCHNKWHNPVWAQGALFVSFFPDSDSGVQTLSVIIKSCDMWSMWISREES